MRQQVRDDRGAFAVLFGILIITIIAIAALVVDIGRMRADRSANIAATDAAALAGAAQLQGQGNGPRTACTAAANYAVSNLALSGTIDCSSWPLSPSACSSSSPTLSATNTIAGVTITIRWPIADSDPAMTDPAFRPGIADRSDGPDHDGKPCARLAVRITQPRLFILGRIANVSGGTTTSESVARQTYSDAGDPDPVPLQILDPYSCGTLVANGGGSANGGVLIRNGGVTPGRIAIDSDATVGCNGAGNTTIKTSGNGFINVWNGSGGAPGQIFNYYPAFGPPQKVYNATTCPAPGLNPGSPVPSGYAVCAKPQPRSLRVGETPFNERYDCKGPTSVCRFASSDTDTSKAYITQFDAFAANVIATHPANVSGGGCSPSAPVTIIDPSPDGTTYVNCASKFIVKNTVVFTGTRVVFSGGVDFSGSGNCLLFNLSAVYTTPGICTNPGSAIASTYRTPSEAEVYITGDLTTGSNLLAAQQTFIRQAKTGKFDINGGIYLVAPYGFNGGVPPNYPQCVGATSSLDAPSASCFEDLVLWNDCSTECGSLTQPHSLAGGSAFLVTGAMYMPRHPFKFNGNGYGAQTDAQFVAYRVTVTGNGILEMVPNPDRSTNPPILGSALIR